MTKHEQNEEKTIAKENSMNMIKKYNFFVPVAVGIGSFIMIKYFSVPKKELLSSVGKVLDVQKTSNVMFGGIGIDKLNEIARSTYRGVKVVVQGEELLYHYKSASGKTVNIAKLVIDEFGKLRVYLGNGPYFSAGSPRHFTDSLVEAIELLKK